MHRRLDPRTVGVWRVPTSPSPCAIDHGDDIPNFRTRFLDSQPPPGVWRRFILWRDQLDTTMPEVSRFYGIVIAIYYNDHAPPHFHAYHAGDEARIEISTGRVLSGSLRPRALRLVLEWLALHGEELVEDWQRARARQPLLRIDPLE